LETGQAVGGEAFAPLADGVAVAVEVRGHLLVGGVAVSGSLKD
jgi:hypothetical protein